MRSQTEISDHVNILVIRGGTCFGIGLYGGSVTVEGTEGVRLTVKENEWVLDTSTPESSWMRTWLGGEQLSAMCAIVEHCDEGHTFSP